MKRRKYTYEQLVDAVKTSTSYRQVMSKLGLVEAGGNYASTKNIIAKYNLDVTHFTGMGWNVGLKFKPNPITPLDKIITNSNISYPSDKLKKRLIDAGYFEKKCYNCNLTEWLNRPITLELEHIDGNHNNNLLSNLTILCPNCHSQTPTWRRQKISIVGNVDKPPIPSE